MSQQINLILDRFQPRFDWLALPVVLTGALVLVLGVVALAGYQQWQLAALRGEESRLAGEAKALQMQMQALGTTLAARRPDPALDAGMARLRADIAQRGEVLRVLREGRIGDGEPGYAEVLAGFSRQVVEGAWLTGFAVQGKEIEIRGRVTEPARLPVYIGRLNGEPAFSGRHFAALDMGDGDPGAGAARLPGVGFALRSENMPQEKAR